MICLLAAITSAQSSRQDGWAIKFDGNKLQHVKAGPFYTPNTNYMSSPFFIEAWIKPGALPGARYWAAQGYGANHILLVGVNDTSPGRVNITGNLNNGININSFQSFDSTPRGVWAHHAVLYVPANHFAPGYPATPTVYTFVNGVLSSQTAMTNPRINSGNWNTGSNTLEIGGTDHSNFDGEISQLRLFEGTVPFVYDLGAGGAGAASFMPERSFRGGFYNPNDAVRAGVSLFYDFRRVTGKTIPDLGIGFNGGTHTGVLSSGYSSYGHFGEPDNYDTDLPTWGYDPVTVGTEIIASVPIPSNAILFDSFSRNDITPFTQRSMNLGLGNLEKGGAWAGATSLYGILSQRSFGISNAVDPVYAEVGTMNMDVRARSGDNFNAGSLPTVYARYTNLGDHLSIYYNSNGYIYMQEVSGGINIQAAYVPNPGNNDLLRIVVSGSTASFYSGNTLLQTFNRITRTGTKAGFFMTGANRIDTFEVY